MVSALRTGEIEVVMTSSSRRRPRGCHECRGRGGDWAKPPGSSRRGVGGEHAVVHDAAGVGVSDRDEPAVRVNQLEYCEVFLGERGERQLETGADRPELVGL